VVGRREPSDVETSKLYRMPEMPGTPTSWRRPPGAKRSHRLTNGPEYEAGLRFRGDIRIWFDEAAIECWLSAPFGRRGGQRRCSDLAIEVGLILRLLFHLPVRQIEGFSGFVSNKPGLTLEIPDPLSFSRQGCTFRL
jgi:hypothetical protein